MAVNEVVPHWAEQERDSLAPLAIGLVIALMVHGGLATTTQLAPTKKMEERIEMAVYHAPPKPPPPPPPPPPEPEKPKPPPPPPPPPPKEPPPPPPPNETPKEPPKEQVPVVTGISMSSTVAGNSGMAVRVGNTTYGDPNKEKFVNPQEVKPYQGGSPEFKAVRQSKLTQEARVLKDFKGPFPRELAEQGVEGKVTLLVDVAKDGTIHDVRLAKSCGNATLDKLAVEYMRRFRMEAARVDGEPVDSILRWTYTFELCGLIDAINRGGRVAGTAMFRHDGSEMSEDLRQHPRFRVALRAHLALPGGTVTTTTSGVSRTGMSVKLSPPAPLEQDLAVTVELPNGTSIDGRARCKSHMPGFLCGMALTFSGDALAYWDAFVDEEESTGSLWRMIGRIARAPDDALAPRGMFERVDTDDLRFHTAGENGEAYRVAFERQASDSVDDCDLATSLPGFREQGRRLVRRVLKGAMTLRGDDGRALFAHETRAMLFTARVAELVRGGYAYVQGDAETPTGLVSLGVGELVLVSKNGQSVFPHFSDADLERIACDTFRSDLGRPVFRHTPAKGLARPAPVALPPITPPVPPRFKEGIDAVRFAQAAADDVQVRRYGDRDVYFHPSVWARVKDEGSELMGPTLHDGQRICVLGLVGPGAPRVVRLDEKSHVTLLKPPAK